MRIARRSLACLVMGARPDRVPIRPFVVAPYIAKLRRAQNVSVRDASARTRTAPLAAPGKWIAFFVYAPVRGQPDRGQSHGRRHFPVRLAVNHASGSGVAQLVQKKLGWRSDAAFDHCVLRLGALHGGEQSRT